MSEREEVDKKDSEYSNEPLRDQTESISEADVEQPDKPDPDDLFSKALGYVKANYEKGWKYRDETSVKDGSGESFSLLRSSISQFGRYGVGLYLYFVYLKYMAICFGIMSLIMIPALYSNIAGTFYRGK